MKMRPRGYQKTDETKIKPGHVQTVWCDLDAITNPEVIPSRTIPGAFMIPIGNGKESALGIMMASWGGVKTSGGKK